MDIDPDKALTFIEFVVERHKIWEARQRGDEQPWTSDETLATRKFTNVFRVLDPGSQFVLTDLLEPGINDVDLLARLFLYRYTNLPATWLHMRDKLGRYPLARDMNSSLVDIIKAKDGNVFSGAYMIIPQPGKSGDKVTMVVELAARLVDDGIAARVLASKKRQEQHSILMEMYGVGAFLAQQVLTDWGYCRPPDLENSFVAPGPGSWKGARELAGEKSDTVEVIRWAHETMIQQYDCPKLGQRLPSLMDIQNCLCEFSKYVRGPRANVYKPAHPGPQPAPSLPNHWSSQ
jgi:hypothetical protein